MLYKEKIDTTKLPKHVAIIMDGNGRWAKERGKQRVFGHRKGADSVRNIVEASGEIGIEYLTLYTFSTENWNRSEAEVNALMSLLITMINREVKNLIENNVRLLAIGNLNRLPKNVSSKLNKAIANTSKCTGLSLILALSYSSKWEIVEAVKNIAKQAINENISIENIDENLLTENLSTKKYPDPELLIRTGGEYRISNFLLWQIAYSELYFTKKYWPEFGKEEFYEAIFEYQSRERRFGKTSEQI
ncbi:MAG: isoprenyl transferase [Bacteroidetes bacterium]|jgi:undecaprenyl diphosphate synthase|nr:isoprenyl transferase [Bacteroidota bacterium]MBT6686326.1 isoprenyl transferase [Bacteroidota bacterium]MBT7142159.1 isoprenyl transferase [Bacteroidota bacterium]MBT7490486.1 isoprenyl transferase [Bacteroidota bacterium]